MTTIVYDHENQLVACDSRMIRGNGLYNDCFNKIISKGALTFILCGSTCDFDYFVSNYEKYKRVELDDMVLDCSGIMIRENKAYYVFIHDGVFNEDALICTDSYGSGSLLAISAMDFGKTAKEAVEYAATRDSGTGGKVQVYDIATCDLKYD